jgi:hypothetical protein
MANHVKIIEEYFEYTPPINVHGSVRQLLAVVPEKYLSGLHKVTLTNSGRMRKVRGKLKTGKYRVRPADCRGLYADGHVRLLIDQIFCECPEYLLLFPPLKKFLIAKTLYHEVGHHIHKLESPGYRPNREAFADEWRDKLLPQYFRRYWYLTPFFRVAAAVARLTERSEPETKPPSVSDTA